MNKKRSIRAWGQDDQELIPGIPNKITLDQICTKLPWKTFYVLSKVSRAWRREIQSHRVYDARVGCPSTETLLVHMHFRDSRDDFLACQVVALYSVTYKRCLELPPIPWVERGIPMGYECISLVGKIYVLGGAKWYDVAEDEANRCEDDKEVYKEVYVFDLAKPTQWTLCASMQEGRHRFGCGVKDGKIYVFGGAGKCGPVGSEVYDPQRNTWSPIKPMPSLRFRDHHVTTLGEELAVYGGVYCDDAKTAEEVYNNAMLDHEWTSYDFIHEALSLEVYHPLKDEWRVVDPFAKDYFNTRTIFEARGNLHSVNQSGVFVYDGDNSSWKVLHQTALAASRLPELKFTVCATAIVNDKLFAAAIIDSVDTKTAFGICLLEGQRFGTASKSMVWQILERCRCNNDTMYAMQL